MASSRHRIRPRSPHPAVPGTPVELSALTRAGVPSAVRRDLPVPGRLRLGDLDLGSGRPASVRGLGPEHGPAPSATLWLTDREIRAPMVAWQRLIDWFPETGLWPLVLTSLGTWGCERPWDSGELEPVPLAAIDEVAPEAVLAEGWAEFLVPIGTQPYVAHLRPFGTEFPGLSAAGRRGGRPVSVPVDALAPRGRARIGLVPCARPADAVAAIGWQGAINRRSAVELSAVLRSWEDRHGIVLAGLGFATLTLLVPHPPADETEAQALAAELAALCPDVLAEDGPVDGFGLAGDGTLAGLAQLLGGRPVWKLWWD